MRLAIFLSVISLLACGKPQSSKSTQVTDAHNAYAVSSASALPACDDAHKDWLFYVEDDKKFRVCQNGAWTEIDLTGPAGAAAPNPYDKSLLSGSLFCGGALQGTALSFNYSAAIFKTGDVIASAGIYGSSFEIGYTNFYAKSQVGAATAAVVFTYDPDGTANGGFWTISVDRTTLVTTIVLKDPDSPSGQQSWAMTPDKCILNSYP